MIERRIGIGLLGGGMISQIAHLPFYLKDPRCRVVAVAEARPSLIAHLESQGLNVVSDHRALLEDADVEAIVISTPRAATGPLTLAALERGKHVMAEKPMAHTVDQGMKLVAAAAKSRLIYAVGFMKRYDPGVEAARNAVADALISGRLGKLLAAHFYDHSKNYACPPPPHRRPDESRAERFPVWPLWPDWLNEAHRETYAWFLNAGSHDVNLLHYFFPSELKVHSASSPNPGALTALLGYDAVPITLEVTKTAAGRWLEGAEFLFEDGRIAVSIPSPMATELVGEVTIDDPRSGKIASKIDTERGWCFERQARGFVDALAGEAVPATSGAEGLADLALTEDIWRHIAGSA